MMKTKWFKRILSVTLVLALMMTYLPLSALAASASDALYERVTDAGTMDNWKKYFDLTNLDTANAGGVWTDKSVFTNASAFDGVTMVDDGKNFLTALSALAANKEVVGYSTVPTDTVLVLDLSGSMNQDEGDLVDATNDAIAKLLSENKNNRVGVVAYSASGDFGASTYAESVTRLLPIGRYTATNGAYLTTNNNVVSIGRTLRVEGETSAPSFSNVQKSVSGGTYIQAGLWEAYEMFNAVPDDEIVIGDNNWQSGDYRMPILVLMSDGAPTTGTSYFADVKNSQYRRNNSRVMASDVGNGSDSGMTAGQGFLVQLTASYIKNRIENKYRIHEENGAGRSLFYTLGFNVTAPTSEDATPNNIAYSVLNPEASTLTDALWVTYAAAGSTMQVNVKNRNGGNSDVTISKNSYATAKTYVNEYFSASGTGLADAFEDIVDEIILQSRYYPTHLEGGSPDFAGYVEFADRLGAYMEVKHIHGIELGDAFFDGHMMASKLTAAGEDGLGTPEAPTALGDEFIRAVKTRLGIVSTAEAQALVAKAFADGQLAYKSATEWSNYIAWYAKADGSYVGFYDEDGTEPVPADAVYLNRSYGFLGETHGSIKNSDMMYMSVQVHKNIETGDQTVIWRIPAALVPMVTYLVKLDGTSVDNATNVLLSVEDAATVAPIRLIYETGLRADLNPYNITRITGAANLAADGHTRVFWNNFFDISAASHDQHVTALAEFTPNKDNERFYYTFDSAVFRRDGSDYVLLTQGEAPAAGGEYYHRRYVFRDGVTTPVFFYERMSAESVAAARWKTDYETLTGDHGAWVVPKGTPARELQMYDEQKAQNPTASAHMVFHPYIAEHNNLVYVDMNLGNNGLLSVTPATGIKVTKQVDLLETGTDDTFAFRIEAALDGRYDSYVTAAGETPSGEPTALVFRNGAAEFTLKSGETLWIDGVPAGTAYTVEELPQNADYKVKSVHVNGAAATNPARGTVAQYLVDDVFFVNTAVGEGNLAIIKTVVDAQGNAVDIADSVKFTMEVALTDAQGAAVSGTFETAGGTLTVPASGKFTVTLAEGESFVLRGIPEMTRYTVTETNIPAGFAYNAALSAPSGVVDATTNDLASIVNTYAPTAVGGADVSVLVTKTIAGNRTSWLAGESYTFTVAAEDGRVVATDSITAADTDKQFTVSLAGERYAAAGTYRYRVFETVGTQGGITYDTTERRFAVTVADSDRDGDLEIVSVANELSTVVSGRWQVRADFTNLYAPSGAATVTIAIDKTMSGSHSLAGYQFALYDADPSAGEADEIVRSALTDAAGKTAITLSYPATAAGKTYTYYLAELGRGETLNNILHDSRVYPVTVTVTDNLDGTVSANAVVSGLPSGATNPVFENVYVPSASDFVTLTGKKVIRGDRRLNAGEFRFAIAATTAGAPMPAETVVSNAADGSFAFSAIEFDDSTKGNVYVYTVTEQSANPIGGFDYDDTVYTVTVTVKDNGDHTVTATAAIATPAGATEDILFENVYDAEDAVVTLSGEKLLTGKTLQADEFTFVLAPVTAGAPMPTSATAKNAADGVITFAPITYAKAGTYVYTLAEQNGGVANYDYDESVYTVTVTVTDNSQGKLFAAVALAKDGAPAGEVVFRNGFTPSPILFDIYDAFGGDKTLTGRELTAGEFEFTLVNARDGAPIGAPVTNAADGKVAFPPVALHTDGIHHFKIVETVGDEAGVTYDTTAYHIRLEVTQDANGVLSVTDRQLHKAVVTTEEVGGVLTEVTKFENVTAGGRIAFANAYKAAPTAIVIGAEKTLDGRTLAAEEFEFSLYDEDMKLVETVKNAADGTVTFAPIPVEKAGEYRYTVREVKGSAEGVTYDETEYTVIATVTDLLDGSFRVTYAYEADGEAAESVAFVNVYTAPTPPAPQPTPEPTPIPAPEKSPMTGDDLVLWFALLFVGGGLTATLVVMRKRQTAQK